MSAERRPSEASAGEPLLAARIDLAASHRLAVRFGLHEAIDNHFTLMVPGSADQLFLAPFGLHWSEIRARDFLVIDFARRVVSGRGLVEDTAFYIHVPLHRRLSHARCVLHTHMPSATALAMLERPELEMALQTSAGFYGDVAYDLDYRGLALDESEGERLADALGSRSILVMGNHGALVVGDSVAEAFDRLYYFERACQTQLLALSTGRALRAIPSAVLEQTRAQFREVALIDGQRRCDIHFAALKRLLDRSGSDYAG
jgi:ribulose-5-phosphate 4-epimerase/fuculose-1-phosphate aldolase